MSQNNIDDDKTVSDAMLYVLIKWAHMTICVTVA